MAARLRPGDRQRLLRALEVRLASGRSLLEWQALAPQRLALPARVVGIALLPAAEIVGARVRERLGAMLAAGAMGEVEDLLARRPEALSLPIAKVHGMRELAAVTRGEIGLDAARSAIEIQVRRYAKRQRTWFRHQLPELRPCAVVGEADAALRFAADSICAMAGPDILT
jgi:tRNA dimethylallyltransferase